MRWFILMSTTEHGGRGHSLVSTSGSCSSKAGMAVIHWMGVELTMKDSITSPMAAASSTLTWAEDWDTMQY